jgi:hypothetical protein
MNPDSGKKYTLYQILVHSCILYRSNQEVCVHHKNTLLVMCFFLYRLLAGVGEALLYMYICIYTIFYSLPKGGSPTTQVVFHCLEGETTFLDC